ncbi:DUF692 domain-containing protein [Mesoterricola sediminis]|uniref:UPF0276 protein n=1 Tax=Mesoterricola sediminis TaxID=2927980 RepID=A0AA48GWM4_9BACT|nr:DUF692 domain-containing protein [Mesoterricola sediminis]BDU75765.1 UPF0276 protein [Mesoterricola sediminis]
MNGEAPTGVGLGLRLPFLGEAAARDLDVPFWEIAPENVIGGGGAEADLIRRALARRPVISHGLSLGVGGFDPLDGTYLDQLGAFLEATGSPWHSEHLCFTAVDGATTLDLLPMPFTRDSARHAAARSRALRAALPVPLLLENITYYGELGHADLTEAQFLAEVLEGADVGWLLDVNNVYVNALNFGFDPFRWLEAMPLDRVAQMHVAGHHTWEGLVVDTHGAPVPLPVVDLMAFALARIGRPVPVLLERDNHIPPLPELLAERARLQEAYDQALAATA